MLARRFLGFTLTRLRPSSSMKDKPERFIRTFAVDGKQAAKVAQPAMMNIAKLILKSKDSGTSKSFTQKTSHIALRNNV